MEKKFKCQSCGHEFVADTNQYVTCPKCDSDNIALVKTTSPVLKIVLLVVAALAIIGGVVAAIKAYQNREIDDTAGGDEPIIEEQDSIVTEEKIIEDIERNLPEEIVFTTTGTPVYDIASGTYSVNVAARVQGASDPSAFTMTYSVSELGSDKTIATNETGSFRGLRPIVESAANPECTYQIIARAMNDGACVDSISTNISGFVVVATNIDKISTAQVQAIIDSKSSAAISNNPHFASSVAVRCNGDTGDSHAPKTLSKLIKDISMGIFEGARVVSLEYDNNNRVTTVIVTLIIPQ